jgi:hypothetical protein
MIETDTGGELFVAGLTGLDEKSLLFQDGWIAIHQMCQGAEIILV